MPFRKVVIFCDTQTNRQTFRHNIYIIILAPHHLESCPSMGGRLLMVAGRFKCDSGEGEDNVTRGGEHTRISTWRGKNHQHRQFLLQLCHKSTSGVKSPIIRDVTWFGERLPRICGYQHSYVLDHYQHHHNRHNYYDQSHHYQQDKVHPQNISITMNNLVERPAMGEPSSPGGRRA